MQRIEPVEPHSTGNGSYCTTSYDSSFVRGTHCKKKKDDGGGSQNQNKQAIKHKQIKNTQHRQNRYTMSASDTAQNSRNDPEFRTKSTNSEEYDVGSKAEVNGAAVAGGIVGILLGGPIIAALAAAGAAYLAASKEGGAGDLARKSGNAVNDLGKSIVHVEKENKIMDKIANELVKSARWVEKHIWSTNKNPERRERETEAHMTS